MANFHCGTGDNIGGIMSPVSCAAAACQGISARESGPLVCQKDFFLVPGFSDRVSINPILLASDGDIG